MGDYPLNQFLKPETFRKMVFLQMPDSAQGIRKQHKVVLSKVDDVTDLS